MTNFNPFDFTRYFDFENGRGAQEGFDLFRQAQQLMERWFVTLYPEVGMDGLGAQISDNLTAEGHLPQLDALLGYDAKLLRFIEAGAKLAAATADLQTLVSGNWFSTFQRYVGDALQPDANRSTGVRALMNSWLTVANDSVLHLQRSAEYLEAQRRFVVAQSEFRRCYQEIVDLWLEQQQMPTRAEVDDLSRTMQDMKRELRRLRKEMSDVTAEPPVVREAAA